MPRNTSDVMVEGGIPALNTALLVAEQISLLLGPIGLLANAGIQLVGQLTHKNADAATIEQARAAIQSLRQSAQGLVSSTETWLDTHPRT